jgi:hypothetical protein
MTNTFLIKDMNFTKTGSNASVSKRKIKSNRNGISTIFKHNTRLEYEHQTKNFDKTQSHKNVYYQTKMIDDYGTFRLEKIENSENLHKFLDDYMDNEIELSNTANIFSHTD